MRPVSDSRRVSHVLRRIIVPLIVAWSAAAQESDAQQADSLYVPPDTTVMVWQDPFAARMAERLPARTYAFELIEMLRDEPASFLYDLGAYGWPHGWAPSGTAPQHLSLTWNDVPLNDLFSGRPLFEILPLNSADIPFIEYGRDAPVEIGVRTRQSYERTGNPLTELAYQTSNSGLQKVSGLHTQNRRISVAGRPGGLNVIFSYGGEGANGQYPGSRVKQGRQIYSRLKYSRPGWSLEIGDLYNKRSTGAHGGVIPRVAGDFDTIYQRLGANVGDSDAFRSIKRNDLFATIRVDPGSLNRRVTTLTAGFTQQRSEYRRPGDTLAVRATSVHFRLSHALVRTSHRLQLEVSGSSTTAGPRSMALTFEETTDSRLHAAGQGEIRLGGLHAVARAGIETRKEGSLLIGRIALRHTFGPAAVRLDASQTAAPVRLIDRTGLGDFLRPVPEIPLGASRLLRGSLSISGGPADLSLVGTVTDNSDWIDYFGSGDPDSVVARTGDDNLRIATAGLNVGFRRSAARGIYLTVQPTLFALIKTDSAPVSDYGDTLPDFYAVARLGARYLLFQGDLDLDISVRGRYWSEFGGRSFHTQTGLLAIPTTATRPVESSAALDLIVSGGVRTATLFLAYENFLAGTSFLPGNLIVPVYPLPEKRLRFGVFWPLQN